MDKDELATRLEHCVVALDKMIDGVVLNAMSQNIDPYMMQSANGAPLMAPLVISQASCLMILASLNQ